MFMCIGMFLLQVKDCCIWMMYEEVGGGGCLVYTYQFHVAYYVDHVNMCCVSCFHFCRQHVREINCGTNSMYVVMYTAPHDVS